MQTTNELEKALESGTGYMDCFKGIDLRRTEIVCVTWAIQNLCGSAFMGYSTYFYEQAGLSTLKSFDMSMAQVCKTYRVPFAAASTLGCAEIKGVMMLTSATSTPLEQ
jgi:hypothetical protein